MKIIRNNKNSRVKEVANPPEKRQKANFQHPKKKTPKKMTTKTAPSKLRRTSESQSVVQKDTAATPTVRTCGDCARRRSNGWCVLHANDGFKAMRPACDHFVLLSMVMSTENATKTCSDCKHRNGGWCHLRGEGGRKSKSPACDAFESREAVS